VGQILASPEFAPKFCRYGSDGMAPAHDKTFINQVVNEFRAKAQNLFAAAQTKSALRASYIL